jgi:probable phosphoglycerate mutase
VTEQQYRQPRFTRPPGACEILLVRHGESAAADPANPFPLVDGQGDPPLHDPDGLEQAERVAERFIASGERPNAIYVTSLQRTVQTAAPLLAHLDIDAVVEPRLREVHLGDWEGGEFRKRVAQMDPIIVEMGAQQRWDVIPGAEPQDDFAGRCRDAITWIAAAHLDQTVAVFTHGGVIAQVLALAAQSTNFAFMGADNASISHLVIAGDRWNIRRFNDTSHLSPTFSAAGQALT